MCLKGHRGHLLGRGVRLWVCVGVSGLGVGDIVLADTGIGDVELVAYGRRARAYVGDGAGGVGRVGVLRL